MIAQELDAITAAVDDFARRAVAPLVAQPEKPVPAAALDALDAGAQAAGILPHPAEPGWALWETEAPVPLSLAVLRRIGQESAGIAYRFHVSALSARVARDLGLAPAGTLVAWEGPGAFGKGALAALFRGEPHAAAADVFPRVDHAAWVHAAGGWARVVVPDASLGWRSYARESAEVEPERAPHGLLEAPFVKLTLRAEGARVAAPAGAAVLTRLLGMHALGAVAAALGAVERAKAKALAYAHERRQGGALLREHAAIQLLIADASVAAAAVDAMLAACDSAPEDPAGLARILRIRAAAHPLLCSAANQCLQVFGGYGYMQDYGMEKIVRDCNALRFAGASPTELRLHAAAEELYAWSR